jgi:hypothetical protein
MKDEDLTESDVSDEADDAPEDLGTIPLDKIDPTADSEISGDLEGNEAGYTFPGPGA